MYYLDSEGGQYILVKDGRKRNLTSDALYLLLEDFRISRKESSDFFNSPEFDPRRYGVSFGPKCKKNLPEWF